jgi:diacylglycerol O-acyltransferase / wax synthase
VIRLSLPDIVNLALETPRSLMHQAALGVLDGPQCLDDEGHVRLGDIRADLESKLGHIPGLRHVLQETGPLGGRPVWIDDPSFRIENHVRLARLPDPGGEAQLLAFAEQRIATMLDRSRPLWEIWLLEGYGESRVGIFFKVHHALADGPAMVNMVGQLFDLTPTVHRAPAAPWFPAPPPSRTELVKENLARKATWSARAAGQLLHPVLLGRSMAKVYGGVAAAVRQGSGAPRTSINAPTGIARRIGATRLPLDEVKDVAHAQSVKLNDVFLYVVVRGLRDVLLQRGEPVDGVELRASIAVSLRRRGDTTTSGNLVGNMLVHLPMDCPDPVEGLAITAAASARAKSTQRAAGAPGVMVALSSTGLTRRYLRHQHMVNLVATNLPGPPVPLYFVGARLRDVIAIAPLAGNVTASFAALSYDEILSVSVQVDERAWPDLDVLTEGIRTGWLDLRAITLT